MWMEHGDFYKDHVKSHQHDQRGACNMADTANWGGLRPLSALHTLSDLETVLSGRVGCMSRCGKGCRNAVGLI